MFDKTYVALDITGSSIRALSVKKNRVGKWGTTPLEAGLVKDGVIKNPEAVSVTIDHLLRSLKLKRNRVICTLTGLPFIYRLIGMPEVSPTALDEAIRREAKREMSVSEEDMYLLWQTTQTRTAEKDQVYFVLGLPKPAIKVLAETLTKANVKPFVVGVKPLALGRVASRKDAIVASLEPDYIDIVAISDGVVRMIHSITPTGKSTTHASLVNEFVEALDRTEKSLKREQPKMPVNQNTPLLLSGELSADENIVRRITEATGRPVSVVEWPAFSSPYVPAGTYAANVGLLLKRVNEKGYSPAKYGYHDINVNILSAMRTQRKFKLQPAYAITTAVFIIAALWGGRAYTLNQSASERAGSLQDENEALTAQIIAAKKAGQATMAQKSAADNSLQTLNTQLSDIQSSKGELMDMRRDFADRIQLIMREAPSGTILESISLDPSTITVTGRALNAHNVVVFGNALETNALFADARVATIEPAGSDTEVSFQIDITE